MNIYSKHFRGKLGFKDVKTARAGVRNLEQAYRYFDEHQDRAGQHHALEMGLMMLDRARWTGKLEEAEIYRRWLAQTESAARRQRRFARSEKTGKIGRVGRSRFAK